MEHALQLLEEGSDTNDVVSLGIVKQLLQERDNNLQVAAGWL